MSNVTTFSRRDNGLACFWDKNQEVARARETGAREGENVSMGATASRVTALVGLSRTQSVESSRIAAATSELESRLKGTVEPAVGPVRHGSVFRVDEFAGLAYVVEARTNKRFKLSRRFVAAEVFDALRKGTPIAFRENGHNAVAAAVITPR